MIESGKILNEHAQEESKMESMQREISLLREELAQLRLQLSKPVQTRSSHELELQEQPSQSFDSIAKITDNIQNNIPIWRRMPALISLFFVSVNLATLPIFIAQTVLIAYGNETYKYLGFVLFNLFSTNWATITIIFGISWAGSTHVIRAGILSTFLICVFETVWLYFYFSVVAAVPMVICGIIVILQLRNADTMFKLTASQPYNSSFETWLNSFRLFAIIIVPVAATYIRTGSATAISFYAILIFNICMVCFCNRVRGGFNMNIEAKTVGDLLNHTSWHHFFAAYLPIIFMLMTFLCFYLVTTAGLDRSDVDLTVFNITLATIFAFFVSWFGICGTYADYSPPESFVHRKLSSITAAQYTLLLERAGR